VFSRRRDFSIEQSKRPGGFVMRELREQRNKNKVLGFILNNYCLMRTFGENARFPFRSTYIPNATEDSLRPRGGVTDIDQSCKYQANVSFKIVKMKIRFKRNRGIRRDYARVPCKRIRIRTFPYNMLYMLLESN